MYGDTERVRIQNERFYDALCRQNLLSMEQLWSHSPYVRCVHPGWRLLVGWESIRDSWRDIFTNSICLTVKPERPQITIIGPMAIVTCREKISSFTLEGSRITEAQTTNIFEKREGEWMLVHHHASPVAEGRDEAETH